MYKLIIGNVRITVLNDDISRLQATEAAKSAIASAGMKGKLLSHVEVGATDDGLEVKVTEKLNAKVARKTIKQSMLDSLHSAIREKLYPQNTFTQKDVWYDGDTGQEWHGVEVDTARSEIISKFEDWMKSYK